MGFNSGFKGLSKSLQNQTCTYVRDSLYTSLKNSHCWNKKVSFCTMLITAFLHACCVLLVSDCTPSMRLNYTAVLCHCCWHTAFTCSNLSSFWKMIVSFSTVLVRLAYCFYLFQPFTILENDCVIQHCVSECSPSCQHFYIPEIQVDYVSGYIIFIFIAMVHDSRMQKWKSWHTLSYSSKDTHVPLALWWIWDSFQSWSTNFFHSFKATVTSLIFMDPCIVVWSSRSNQQVQPCNRIYYSTVH